MRPGVRICLDHDELLHEVVVDRAAWDLPPAKADRAGRYTETLPEGQICALRTVARLSASLMGCGRLDLAQMKLAAMVALRSQGVLTAARPLSAERLQVWFASLPLAAAIGGQLGLDVLADGTWVHDVLHGRRVAHPVKWLLLWSAIFDGVDGDLRIRLMHSPDQMIAWDPEGQGLLWPEAQPNHDPRLKATVEAHATVSAAASALGVSTTAVRRYMKAAGCRTRDIRAASQREQRLGLAMRAIDTYISANPTCTRSHVHDLCKTQVSWLRRWAPETLAALLARLPDSRDRQEWLSDSDSEVVVAGHAYGAQGQRRSTLNISSALVSSETASALVRALQSIDNAWDYKIPEQDDHLEIDDRQRRTATSQGKATDLGARRPVAQTAPWLARRYWNAPIT